MHVFRQLFAHSTVLRYIPPLEHSQDYRHHPLPNSHRCRRCICPTLFAFLAPLFTITVGEADACIAFRSMPTVYRFFIYRQMSVPRHFGWFSIRHLLKTQFIQIAPARFLPITGVGTAITWLVSLSICTNALICAPSGISTSATTALPVSAVLAVPWQNCPMGHISTQDRTSHPHFRLPFSPRQSGSALDTISLRLPPCSQATQVMDDHCWCPRHASTEGLQSSHGWVQTLQVSDTALHFLQMSFFSYSDYIFEWYFAYSHAKIAQE